MSALLESARRSPSRTARLVDQIHLAPTGRPGAGRRSESRIHVLQRFAPVLCAVKTYLTAPFETSARKLKQISKADRQRKAA